MALNALSTIEFYPRLVVKLFRVVAVTDVGVAASCWEFAWVGLFVFISKLCAMITASFFTVWRLSMVVLRTREVCFADHIL